MKHIGRRYQVINLLGSGGMGTVYRAVDRFSGARVALKQINPPERRQTLSDITDSSALRLALAGEFRLMASLHHPNIVRVLDYGFARQNNASQPYYTMDLLDGAQTIIDAGKGAPTETQIDLIVQLLRALAYLHRRKIVHRDLKPSNILVIDGRVKVLDFGLSIIDGQHSDAAGTTVGTLGYMAPEVMAGDEATAASDLYAVGVLAYELLAGAHPFNLSDPNRLILQVMREYPDTTLIPTELGFFILTLMAKEPSDRYPSAELAIQGISDATALAFQSETVEIRESFLRTAPMVGRDTEFNLLMRALGSAIGGRGSAWLIGGESGVGKSRLLDEIAVQAMVQGALVLRGQGVAHGAAPYQHWRQPVRWLCLLGELTDDELAALRFVVPDIADMLGRQLPDLPRDAKTLRGRLTKLLPSLLIRIDQPILLILEDLHWAGSDTLTLLRPLIPLIKDVPVLIIASYRDDEHPSLPALLPEMQLLKLQRLGDSDIATLSEAILGEPGRRQSVVHLLQRETEGNVFFLTEVIRALADEAGQLDQIGLITLPAHIFAGGVQQVIQRRLSRVPDDAQPLLRLAAVAGREVDLRLLMWLAHGVNGSMTPDFERWLAVCANAAVLETQDGEWRFAHDKLRDAILAPVHPEARAELARMIAISLETLYPNNSEQAAALAHHWKSAGEIGKSLYYLLIAGESLLRGGVYQEALAAFREAREMAHSLGGDPAMLADVWRLEAEAHLGLGHYDQARQLYESHLHTMESLNDDAGSLRAHQRLGDIAYTLEDYATAEDCYQRALTLARAISDPSAIAAALHSLGDVAFDLDQVEKATQLYQASLSVSRATGEHWGIAGSIAQAQGAANDADET
jgi:tetratricopeptide (TPR) repeat protein